MAKLQIENLTPELLTEVSKLTTVDEVVKYFADKGFEVSPKVAERILEGSKRESVELTDEELKAIAAGGVCDKKKTSATRS